MRKIINFLKGVLASVFYMPGTIIIAIGIVLYGIGSAINDFNAVKTIINTLKNNVFKK